MVHRSERSTILFVSQVYVPDPAAVGQHLAGAAAELARRGHRVVTFTSARGYYDPSVRYPSREQRDGVEIRRFGVGSLGKRSILSRVLGGLLFLGQATVHGLLLRRLDTIVVTTSPPMAAIAALIIGLRRRVRVKYWIMDLNPDQAVALGAVEPASVAVKAMEWLNRRILRRADDVVVLDRFMADRVSSKWPGVRPKMAVLPPWPLESVADPLPPEENEFRHQHGLDGKFVVMYSGNHSPANPLDTLLAAAERLEDDPDLVFLFVGGGAGKREVEASRARGVRSLPYQPLSMLRQSLSAGDVHVVTIGDEMVGIIHPCKVYGAMAVARPVLMFGPPENHVADILRQDGIGMQVAHHDVDAAVQAIQKLRHKPRTELAAMGRRAQAVIGSRLSRETLMGAVCDVIEGVPSASR
jgi:colanic acid biosynthesis glycosyl transferase WcaI